MTETKHFNKFTKNNRSSVAQCQNPSAVVYARRAFSLIELLVAIGIIALLAAIGIGVGLKISGQSKNKATKANMILIMNAIEMYNDEAPPLLAEEPTPPYKPHSRNLYDQIIDNENAKAKLATLPGDAIGEFGPTGSKYRAFADANGREIAFYPNLGLGGTPVLFSAGSDGEFGSINVNGNYYKVNGTTWTAGEEDERKEAAKDDIRSDK